MAIADGDPRALVPDFLATFNWFERNQALRFYSLRHASTGKNHPPDEAPASIARRAMVVGAYSANTVLGALGWFLLLIWNLFAPDSAYLDLPVLIPVGLGLMLLGMLVGNLRHRRINRYFAEHFPGSLDFRDGTSQAAK